MHNHEDMAVDPRDDTSRFHAVLGEGRVRLCGYKAHGLLFVDGAETAMPNSRTLSGGTMLEFVMEGWEARVYEQIGFADLWLKEPDGTQWSATCGFEHGAGWEGG